MKNELHTKLKGSHTFIVLSVKVEQRKFCTSNTYDVMLQYILHLQTTYHIGTNLIY